MIDCLTVMIPIDSMPYKLALVVGLIVVVQSLFGIGVLFFGTPILMVFGMPFYQILALLLPISFVINAVQTVMGWRQIQWGMVKRFLLCALFPVVLGTFLLEGINGLFWLPTVIALSLILLSVGYYFNAFPSTIAQWMNHEKTYFVSLGLIHGLTNLGGPLLSSFMIARFPDKYISRATTAVCYGVLVFVQFLSLSSNTTFMAAIGIQQLWFVLLALLVFFTANRWLFFRFSDRAFKKVFGGLLLLIAILLVLRNM